MGDKRVQKLRTQIETQLDHDISDEEYEQAFELAFNQYVAEKRFLPWKR